MKTDLRRKDLLYPELSYKIIGVLFDVFNSLGYHYQEKYYQRAVSQMFKELGIVHQEQVYTPIEFRGKNIGNYFFDFLVDSKIILEIKRGDKFSRSDIIQTLAYLKRSGLSLAILARFSSKGIQYKRILNDPDSYVRKDS